MTDDNLQETIEDAHLRYINDNVDGIKRFKDGKSFIYLGPKAEKIKDKKTLDRINSLVIPPAWKNVWISPHSNTHLQATGFDEKGRKQYLYHPKWIEATQATKFDKMIFFGEVLPKLRRRINTDMKQSGLERNKILATVVWLLGHTFIRVGNEEYVKENKSFGLTTLRNKHVEVKGNEICFEFKGKSGVEHSVKVSDPRVAKVIKQCIELPGFELFQFIDDKGERHIIDSADVNEYLQDVTGEDVSAKEFRTWGGTVLSADTLNEFGDFEDEDDAKKKITETVKTVSKHLRNTPSVCRQYYIHPVVLKTYNDKILIPFFGKIKKSEVDGLNLNEYRVINLLQKYQ